MRGHQERVQGEVAAAGWATKGGGTGVHGEHAESVADFSREEENESEQLAKLLLRPQHCPLEEVLKYVSPDQLSEKSRQHGKHAGAAAERNKDRRKRVPQKGASSV